MTSRLGFKFPTPYVWGSNSPSLPEDHDYQIPFSPGSQRGQMPGVCPGGGGGAVGGVEALI